MRDALTALGIWSDVAVLAPVWVPLLLITAAGWVRRWRYHVR